MLFWTKHKYHQPPPIRGYVRHQIYLCNKWQQFASPLPFVSFQKKKESSSPKRDYIASFNQHDNFTLHSRQNTLWIPKRTPWQPPELVIKFHLYDPPHQSMSFRGRVAHYDPIYTVHWTMIWSSSPQPQNISRIGTYIITPPKGFLPYRWHWCRCWSDSWPDPVVLFERNSTIFPSMPPVIVRAVSCRPCNPPIGQTASKQWTTQYKSPTEHHKHWSNKAPATQNARTASYIILNIYSALFALDMRHIGVEYIKRTANPQQNTSHQNA